jgi:hypothetical protein
LDAISIDRHADDSRACQTKRFHTDRYPSCSTATTSPGPSSDRASRDTAN